MSPVVVSMAPVRTLNPFTEDPAYGRWVFQYARTLLIVSNLQPSMAGIIIELINNAQDAARTDKAGKKLPVTVTAALGQKSISVSDNGHGMVPFILEEDWGMLQLFWEEIGRHTYDPEDEIRKLLSLESRQSLEWLALSAGFSGKLPEMDKRGRIGVGAQGFRQIANKAVWRTRPDRELAERYWGEGTSEAKMPPVFVLEPPTAGMLESYNIEPRIERALEPPRLMDVLGDELVHGTMVHITELKQGVMAGLRLHDLLSELSERFSEDLRSGQLILNIVDRYTEEGRKTQGGKLIPVLHANYSGVQLYAETVTLSGMTFQAHLWYDRQGKNLHAKLRRGDQDMVKDMDDPTLGEFKGTILASGKVNGWISCPNDPVVKWDLNKGVPTPGQARNVWAKGVLEIALAEFERRVEQIEDQTRQEKVDRVAAQVAARISEQLPLLKDFQGLEIGTRKLGTRPPRAPQPKKVEERIFVTVDDEHNRGVEGVILTCSKGGKPLRDPVTTGKSGEVSFGKVYKDPSLGFGRYAIEIKLPDGMTLLNQPAKVVFNLDPSRLGVCIHFHVLTGREAPLVHRIARLRPVVHPFEGSTFNQIWSASRIENGIVDINSAHELYQRALSSKSDEPIIRLITQALIAAITSYHYRNSTPEEALQASTRAIAALN